MDSDFVIIKLPVPDFKKTEAVGSLVFQFVEVAVERGSEIHQAYEAIVGGKEISATPITIETHVPLIQRCPILRKKYPTYPVEVKLEKES